MISWDMNLFKTDTCSVIVLKSYLVLLFVDTNLQNQSWVHPILVRTQCVTYLAKVISCSAAVPSVCCCMQGKFYSCHLLTAICLIGSSYSLTMMWIKYAFFKKGNESMISSWGGGAEMMCVEWKPFEHCQSSIFITWQPLISCDSHSDISDFSF